VWFESFVSSVLQDIKDELTTINDKNVVVAILILFILKLIYAVLFLLFYKLRLKNSYTGNPLQSGCILCLRKTSIRDYWLSETNFIWFWLLAFSCNLQSQMS